jgi:XTP/dITP diphosphohydrolase
VADTLAAKLIRRHPHVFGDASASTAGEVEVNWEEIKKAERAQKAAETGSGPPSVLDGVVFGQPALALAAQLQRRAVRAGFPDSLPSADGGGPVAEEVGEELFRLVARASAAGTDPELELRSAARRYAELLRSWERSSPPTTPGS